MANGIDTASFAPKMPKEEAKSAVGVRNKTLVLFVGRLAQQKSLPTLLSAMKPAAQSCPNLHLLLVGDGPEREALEAMARDLNIREVVTFVGRHTDVKPFLQAADIFVLPSEKEGMSNALLEAMATGLPCIATPVGASPQLLDHGRCGLLVPVGDVDAWANALIDLERNSKHRGELGHSARQRVLTEYDFSVVGTRYEALYQDLILHEFNRTRMT
jgi:glycosyltransferase involved in cell wall biosynthesis